MPKKNVVSLTDEQRSHLEGLVSRGRESARKIARARVLPKAADGETDAETAEAVGVSARTAERVRKRFAVEGLGPATDRRPQPARPWKRVPDGAAEARLVTLACSKPLEGYGHWTLDLLADRMVRLNFVPDGKAVSRDTVGWCLKKTRPSPGRSTSGASPRPAASSWPVPELPDVYVRVMDDLNTHLPGSLYEAFGPAEARRITSKLQIHYTPFT